MADTDLESGAALRFMGCSVTNVNINLGLGSEETSMNIGFVQDIRYDDVFTPLPEGSPYFLHLGDFEFNGILQNVNLSATNSGYIGEATVVDPRSILEGIQVICNDYNGPVSDMLNMVNPFGYLESFGFGTAHVIDSGVSWNQIRDALTALCIGQQSTYCGILGFRGYSYGIDITQLPFLSPDFRLDGTMSFMDLINQVCEAAGLDFHVTLHKAFIGSGVIRVNVINRRNLPVPGTITRFVSLTEGAVAKSLGSNYVMEPTSKFITGSKKRDVLFVQGNAGPQFFKGRQLNDGITDGYSNTIWPYWGLNNDDFEIVGQGLDDDHVLSIDAREVPIPGVGNYYPTSLGEIRAASSSIQDWMAYLNAQNSLKYLINPFGFYIHTDIDNSDEEIPVEERDTVTYPTNRVNNVHKGKAQAMGFASSMSSAFSVYLSDEKIAKAEDGEIPGYEMTSLIPGTKKTNVEHIYNFVKEFADTYYGKKFMVMIPNAVAYIDPETKYRRSNVIPCDGGYLTDTTMVAAINNKLMPPEARGLMDEETGLITHYVRFDDIWELDFTEIPQDQILFSLDKNSIFIKCEVEPDLRFLQFSPTGARAIITLPGTVKRARPTNESTASFDAIKAIIKANSGDDAEAANQAIAAALKPSMSHMYNINKNTDCVMPQMAAIALESQVSCYGPWYAQAAHGPVVYEQNDSLNPWTYGSVSRMNEAGVSLANDAITPLQVMESGHIEFPGFPNAMIGSQLLGSGPYISSIQINVSDGGVTTTYRMETWKTKFGMLNKLYVNKLAKFGTMINRMRSKFWTMIRRRTKGLVRMGIR